MRRFFKFTTIAFSIVGLYGCGTISDKFTSENQPVDIDGYLFYAGEEPEKEKIKISIKKEMTKKIILLDKRISYRNNRKASIEFELPEEIVQNLDRIEMVLKAYNDDDKYRRAIWFEVDGVGGYIATHYTSPSQVRGEATLGSNQQNMWRFNLSNCTIASDDKGTQIIDFFKILRQPGLHTITSWVSTYEQYGPNSWVSIELVLKYAH